MLNLASPSQILSVQVSPQGARTERGVHKGWREVPSFGLGGSFPQSARVPIHPQRGHAPVWGGICAGEGLQFNPLPSAISSPWERGTRPSTWPHQLTKPQSPLTSTHMVLYVPTKQPGAAAGTQPCGQQHRMGDPACNIAWDTLAREDQHLPWQ